MAMTYSDIFSAYYRLYRAEATVPTSTDDEFTIGISLANEAINYWANYDATYWRELFTTLGTNFTGATTTITTGTKTYAGPTAMREAAGNVRVNDSNGNAVQRYSIIEPHEAQFLNDQSTYAYFTGDPNSGFTLHLNPAPPSSLNGLTMDYNYYKKPTEIASGATVTEMSNPYFIVHRMLAQRFRASRNPYYQSAKLDAENAIKVMQMDNNSGTWANPWKLADNSGAQFGQGSSSSSFGF